MVATVAFSSAFLPVGSSLSAQNSSASSNGKASMALGGNSKPVSYGGVQAKANAQAPPKINGTKVGLGLKEAQDEEVSSSSPSPTQSKTFINQLPDWSLLLTAITTIFLAAEKQWTNLDWKPRRPELVDAFGFGRIVQDGLVFSQNFSIRSYEIGADKTASIETLMNHLQETALNHVRCAGLLGDGFGCTPAMSRRDLIWVVTRMQILADRYPSWYAASTLNYFLPVFSMAVMYYPLIPFLYWCFEHKPSPMNSPE
ncbi:hypothetical protein AMTR_s00142p00112300 [Amborella trichopoda]|uniref:Acyl-[acyl-carrier-protein] hydrolase n=1 Tax=Amborella trichopoda TaxID=13333 RepID=W1PEF8_AMBTC|nr:hypothetical protein AMTR_s00142p00112300 [Amborella trichopoda]